MALIDDINALGTGIDTLLATNASLVSGQAAEVAAVAALQAKVTAANTPAPAPAADPATGA